MPPKKRVTGSINLEQTSNKQKRSPQNRTVRRSSYNILIQTNKKPVSEEHALSLGERLYTIVDEIANSTDELEKVVNWNWQGDKLSEVMVGKPEGKFGVERGPNARYGGRIHAHLVLRLKHKSNFWLDRQKLHDLLVEKWNEQPRMSFEEPIKSLLVRVKLISDVADAEDYATKGAPIKRMTTNQMLTLAKKS